MMRNALALLALVLLLAAPAGVRAQQQSAEEMIKDWPEVSQKAAKDMIAKHGQPGEVTSSRLIWMDKDPFIEIVVFKEPVQHNFPMQHQDVLQHTVAYRVPPDRLDELAQFDGSVIAAMTFGTLSARCDKEEANILALNLADDVLQRRKTTEEARDEYAKAIQSLMQGEKVAAVQELQFKPQELAQTRQPGEQAEVAMK